MLKAKRRVPKTLGTTLYCYVEKANYKHAHSLGKDMFGSASSYVNALIARDRGVKPALGDWKSKGEAKKLGNAKRPKRAGKKLASIRNSRKLRKAISRKNQSTRTTVRKFSKVIRKPKNLPKSKPNSGARSSK